MKIKRYQLNFAEELNKAAMKAHEAGNYLEAGIINFQRTEALLRITILAYAYHRRISPSTIKAIKEEQSFYSLVIFYSLLNPKNNISEKLFALNQKRNSLVHKIFLNYKSPKSLEDELKNFSSEAIAISLNFTQSLRIAYKQ